MSLVLLLLAVVVVGVVVAVAAGRLPAGMPAATSSSPHRPLPPRALEPADLDALRFSVVPRGYRMDQVDAALDRLRAELAERDRRLEALTAAASTPPTSGGQPYGAAPPSYPTRALTREEGADVARFTAHREVAAPADVVWGLVTDWARHGDWIPLTTMTVERDTGGAGTRFTGRSGVGRLAFDDPMEVTSWEPPTPTRAGTAAIDHLGSLVLGHAEVQVVPLPGGRCRLRWTEDISLVSRKLSRAVTLPIAVGGRLAFGSTLKKVAAEAEARAAR